MWIKICGMTSPQAVAAALDAGVEAIGFVFAESPRRVTPEQAARLAAPARGKVLCVAVTLHPGQRELEEIWEGFRPDMLQTDAGDFAGLRMPEPLERLPVVRDPDVARELPGRVLFEGASSGTGRLCDWTAAREIARRTQLVLAGGLDPDNVAAAIEAVRPFGVDVSSGVEASRGVKDPAAIARFVAAARAAQRTSEEL